MGIDPRRAADELEARLRALGTRERAEQERRYLKSELEHHGATVWQIRREVKSYTKEHPELSHAELVGLVEALWAKPVHERRMAAVILLEAYPQLVAPGDLALVERLVRESKTWALVDGLAGDVLGELLLRHPSSAEELDRWAGDPDFWVRRSALLAQIKPLKAGASFDRFARYADAMLDGVLHPKGDRLGLAGDRQDAPRRGIRVGRSAPRPGLRGDEARGGEVSDAGTAGCFENRLLAREAKNRAGVRAGLADPELPRSDLDNEGAGARQGAVLPCRRRSGRPGQPCEAHFR
jgi:3-methyladenine DNA glycosylase AlkD